MDEFLSPHARTVLLGDRRCIGTNRDGERCGRASALGQFVCDRHGAKAPLSIKAGQERLAILVEPALDVLYRATRNAPPCSVCGRSDADRDSNAIRAAIAILDRAGFHPTITVEQAPPRNPFEDMSTGELADRAEAIGRQLREMANAEDTRFLPEVTDGFMVPEEPELPADDPIPSGIITPEKRTDGEEPGSD